MQGINVAGAAELKNTEQAARPWRLVVTALLGALAHTAVCWIALQLDFFRGSTPAFNQLFSLIWLGHGVMALVLLSGLGRRLQDQSMSLPVVLWSVLGLLVSAYFVDQVRLCVMVLFFAILQTGVFRLTFRSFVMVSTLCVAGYAAIIWRVAALYPEAIDVTAEAIQWSAFTLITVGAVLVADEISSIRRQLIERNHQLGKIVDKIQDMAIRDELTGMYNRRHATERLTKIREMGNRNAFGFMALYVDLDHFKRVNDNHGHHVGDEVLREFAKMVRDSLSGKDFAARLGGEEFLVVLVKTDREQGLAMAEKLREAVTQLHFPSAPGLKMSASLGAAEFKAGESLDQLLARADAALYRAKHGGRNRVCLASEEPA
ncbi:MAG: GGDEF domain-containing protein [Alcanivoracaceae bacterium]|jgi:diguanylate cyclase (GGDEF)-like protein|nr:GGDEF domain-containing protein [Alcanivoracaceae bacterium]